MRVFKEKLLGRKSFWVTLAVLAIGALLVGIIYAATTGDHQTAAQAKNDFDTTARLFSYRDGRLDVDVANLALVLFVVAVAIGLARD